MKLRAIVLLTAFVLSAAACGGSETAVPLASAESASAGDAAVTTTTTKSDDAVADTGEAVDDAVADTGEAVDDVVAEAEEVVQDVVDSLEDRQDAAGGGSATMTVGDQSWTFESVLCSIGEEESGQEGTEFVLSSIQDGLQMYFSIDNWGHSASLFDITDFENPSVSLDSTGPYTDMTIDGKTFSGTGEFLDNTAGSVDRIPGSFSGTCP